MVRLQSLPRGHLQEVALKALLFLAGAAFGLLALLPLPWWGWDSDNLITALWTLNGQSYAEVFRTVGTLDAHPPLYYLLHKAWMTAWGFGHLTAGVPEAAVPLPHLLAVLFFALLSGSLALAAHDLLGPWAAFAALGLLFLFWDTPWAFALRMYPLAAALVTLGAWAYLRGRAFAGSLFGLLALYTHYLSGYALLPFALYRLFQDWRERTWRALFPFAVYLLYLPWLPWLLGQVRAGHSRPELRPPPEDLFAYFWQKWPPGVVALFLLLGLVAAWRAPRVRPLLVLALAGPYVWYFTSLLLNTVLTRYNFVFVGPLVLAGAAALAWAPRPARWGASLLLLAAGLFWAHLTRPYWPAWDMVTQARIAERFVERGVPFVLDRWGRGYAPMLAFVAPGLKDKQELLTTGELWRYCNDPRPLLAYRNWFLSPGESLVHRLMLCRGRWREAHDTSALTLFLLPPPGR
ncbi:MAG: hypothetical protein ACP5JV_04805 [Thermus sp.]|uniref:hypothetical protein n=1 Tax=Thermus sp. TaxID=275 RepID=UPI003D0EABD0